MFATLLVLVIACSVGTSLRFSYNESNVIATDDYGDIPGSYRCSVGHQGQRVHESPTRTPFDCRSGSGGNTCKGGQCVALVTCSCTRGGKYPPGTNCWRPGPKVMLSNGKCNRNIPINTAIATFPSGSRYHGHAAIYMGCQNDYTLKVYDQSCCKSIGYSLIRSGTSHFKNFAVIKNPGVCPDRASWKCRWESSGPTCCKTSYPWAIPLTNTFNLMQSPQHNTKY